MVCDEGEENEEDEIEDASEFDEDCEAILNEDERPEVFDEVFSEDVVFEFMKEEEEDEEDDDSLGNVGGCMRGSTQEGRDVGAFFLSQILILQPFFSLFCPPKRLMSLQYGQLPHAPSLHAEHGIMFFVHAVLRPKNRMLAFGISIRFVDFMVGSFYID